jgi:hypothetical protein
MGDVIMKKNQMLGMAFKSMAKYLTMLENSPEDWHLAPIQGHTWVHKLFPFYPADMATMETHGIKTVSQLLETHVSGSINKAISTQLFNLLHPYPSLQHKLGVFICAFLWMPFLNKYASSHTNVTALINLDTNISRRYRLKCQETLDASIGVAVTE